jgi:hypothetical protein
MLASQECNVLRAKICFCGFDGFEEIGDRLWPNVRQTAVPNLSCFSKVFEHQDDLLDRSAGIIAVQPGNVDAINPESPQTRIEVRFGR